MADETLVGQRVLMACRPSDGSHAIAGATGFVEVLVRTIHDDAHVVHAIPNQIRRTRGGDYLEARVAAVGSDRVEVSVFPCRTIEVHLRDVPVAVKKVEVLEPLWLICPKCKREAAAADWDYTVSGYSEDLRCPDCWKEGYSVPPESVAGQLIGEGDGTGDHR